MALKIGDIQVSNTATGTYNDLPLKAIFWNDVQIWPEATGAWFKITNEDTGDMTLSFVSIAEDAAQLPSLAYQVSYDNGTTWQESSSTSITITEGKSACLQFTSKTSATTAAANAAWKINSSSKHSVSGPLSAAYADGVVASGDEYCYAWLFGGDTGLTSASKLTIEAPADASVGAFWHMFDGCSSLTGVPNLSDTALAKHTYAGMFNNCTSLVKGPSIAATSIGYSSMQCMFSGCTSLVTPPKELSATDVPEYAYSSMFEGCSSLRKMPAMSATSVASYGCESMFSGCTSLTATQRLNVAAPAEHAFDNMFFGCTSLSRVVTTQTSAPTLDSSNAAINEWLADVSTSGTLYKLPATSESLFPLGSASGVPEGWSLQDMADASNWWVASFDLDIGKSVTIDQEFVASFNIWPWNEWETVDVSVDETLVSIESITYDISEALMDEDLPCIVNIKMHSHDTCSIVPVTFTCGSLYPLSTTVNVLNGHQEVQKYHMSKFLTYSYLESSVYALVPPQVTAKIDITNSKNSQENIFYIGNKKGIESWNDRASEEPLAPAWIYIDYYPNDRTIEVATLIQSGGSQPKVNLLETSVGEITFILDSSKIEVLDSEGSPFFQYLNPNYVDENGDVHISDWWWAA